MAKDVDILHCHGARAAFWGRLATIGLGAKRPKIIYSIHGFMIPHYPLSRRLPLMLQEKIQAFQIDKYIAVSHAEKENFLRFGLGNSDNVEVVWYGINVERFENTKQTRDTLRTELSISPDQVLLTMICRFFWPRDFPTLLHAFHQAVKQIPGLRLLLVGDGPWRPQIENLLDDLNLRNSVILPGIREDIPDMLHTSDIFVLTSKGGDGLPISILEAMATARPVIATACDGIPEEVIDGETGLIYRLQDVDALTEAMVNLAQNSGLRKQMGIAGQHRVRKHFRVEQMVDKMSAIYREIVTG